MERIRQVIVVEGRHDSEKLKKYWDCDTIETGGTHLGKETLDLIRRAQEKRGVIIFTDPDSPGNRIRHVINDAVPGCLNAFVQKKDAHTSRKVGVEHADQSVLAEALKNLIVMREDSQQRLSMQDLYDLGLCGKKDSSMKREQAGAALHIGNGNAKTMLARMNCLGITRKELEDVL